MHLMRVISGGVYQFKVRTLDDAVCAAVEMEAYKKAEREKSNLRKPLRHLNCVENVGAPDKITDLSQEVKLTN